MTRPERIAVTVLLSYFGARLCYFALSIAPGFPPDEMTHLGRTLAFSHSLWPASDSPATHSFGLITHVPTLYYYCMGQLAALAQFALRSGEDTAALVLLRCANALLGFAAAAYAYGFVSLCTTNRRVRVLFLVLFTNTAMFSFLFGALSYDNGTNLLAAMSLYYLFGFLLRGDEGALVPLLLCLLVGALTKTSFLPFALILLGCLVLHERSRTVLLPRRLVRALASSGTLRVVLGAALLVALLLNLGLYGGNLLRFGRLLPSADRVLGLENALRSEIFARDYAIESFRDGRLSFEEAVAVAPRGDRGVWEILARNRDPERMAEQRMPFGTYTFWWLSQMIRTSQGILATQPMLKRSPVYLGAFGLFMAVALVSTLRSAWRSELPAFVVPAALIVMAYSVLLLLAVHFPTYVRTGNPYLAVQGRYLFPVAAPFYALLCHALLAPLSRPSQLVLASVVATFFVYSDFPYFIAHVTAAWLSS